MPTIRSDYAYVLESPSADGSSAEDSSGSLAGPTPARDSRRSSAAAAVIAALALVALAAHASSARGAPASAKSGPDSAGEFLERAEAPKGGQGGCGFDENCAKTKCCSKSGFKCVKQSEWWSVCQSVDDAANTRSAGDASGEKEEMPKADCSKAGDDCTDSKCCADAKYTCVKRTDGMWWKSVCKKGVASNAGNGDNHVDSEHASGGGDDSNDDIDAADCSKDMPEDVPGQWKVAERCATKLIKKLTRDQKISMLHGTPGGMGYAGYVRIPRAQGKEPGTMRLTMNDGPQGYNGYTDPTVSKGTQFPDLVSVAASFDPKIARAFGKAISEEFRDKGCNVLLGPDVEVVRVPQAGRSFESLTGEDPYLGSVLAAAYVGEVHRHGIIATAKHWLDNEQEEDRQQLDVTVGGRAQHEIYMLPFKAAIDAGAGAVMCSYNKVNGDYACENNEILNTLLREELGFKGFVVSDWGAVHSGAKSVNSGLSVEMPEARYFTDLGSVDDSTIDHLAGGILAAVYAAGQFNGRGPAIDWSWPPPFYRDSTTDEHRETAKRVIIESTVLLKNSASTLPVAKGAKIALVGKACHDVKDPAYGQGSMYSAGGSGFVATERSITPLDELTKLLGDDGSVTWSEEMSGAQGADVVVLCAAAHDEEGKDRTSLELAGAKEMVAAARAADSKQKVVMLAITPGAVETDWIDDVDAALVMFMPGEQIGPAFAELITGKASPAGRLPLTFPKVGEERFTEDQYPGVDLEEKMSDGVLVGYRWNDAKNQPAAFPFGFGLSYTTFELSNFHAECSAEGGGAKVAVIVKNTGDMRGAAVPQLYVGFKSLKPVVRQLRGFVKVHLEPGASEEVVFSLNDEDWRFYDEARKQWRTAPELGEEVTVSVGMSSVDLPLSGKLSCQGAQKEVRFQQ